MKKILKTVLCTFVLALISIGSAVALSWNNQGPIHTPPALVATGGFGANPDWRRVAGSALILKSLHYINEPSIPSNSIVGDVDQYPYHMITVIIPVFYGVSQNGTNDTVAIDHAPMVKYFVDGPDRPEQFPIK